MLKVSWGSRVFATILLMLVGVYASADDATPVSTPSFPAVIPALPNTALQSPSPNPEQSLFPAPTQLHQQAFQSVTQQALPMTPDEIRKFHDMLDLTQRAQAEAPFDKPPVPVTSSMIVSLSPGAMPPVIRLQQGFVSSLVFMDAAGNPWNVTGYDLGNPKAFNIQNAKEPNTLMLQAISGYASGDLAVTLQGLSTPVMLTLLSGQSQVDYRADLHVEGQAPGAPLPSVTGMPDAVSNALLGVLNGIPPEGSKTLQVIGTGCSDSFHNCQAWLLRGTMYLRVPMTLLSPSWIAKIQSSDGMHAYSLGRTPRVIVSDGGKAINLMIEGF